MMRRSSLSTQAARARRPAPARPGSSETGRRYSLILDAEAGRLARELRAIGPMTRQALACRCGAGHWRQGSFDAAVRHGIASGRLRQLPFDFLAAAALWPTRETIRPVAPEPPMGPVAPEPPTVPVAPEPPTVPVAPEPPTVPVAPEPPTKL